MKKNEERELNYDETAELIGCSPRNVRRLLKKRRIKPARHGYRTVGIPIETAVRLKISMIIERRNGHSHTNGKGRR